MIFGKNHRGSAEVMGERQRPKWLLIAALCAAMSVALVACGGDGSSTASPHSTTVTDGAGIGDAGDGEVAFDPASGGRGELGGDKPVPHDMIKTAVWPLDAPILGQKDSNLCADPGWYKPPEKDKRFNTDYEYYYGRFEMYTPSVDVAGLKSENKRSVELGRLSCSVAKTKIWPNTTGPGPNGLTAPCPMSSPFVRVTTGGVYFEYADDHTYAGNMTQAAGDYGRNKDGLFGYMFHNWNNRDVIATIWVVCQ